MEFQLVIICAYTVTAVPKYVPSLPFAYIFQFRRCPICRDYKNSVYKCPRNMRQNFGIRSHIPNGTIYFMWTCVQEFFHSVTICPPRRTSRNVNFHNHNLSVEENPRIVLSCHQHLGRHLTTTYWHVTYFHNVSRDLTATSPCFRKLSHVRSDILLLLHAW